MLKLLYIDNPRFTDELWQRYYELLEELHKRYNTRFTQTSWLQTKERMLSYAKAEKAYRRFVVSDGDRMVGWASLRVSNPGTSKQAAYFDFDAAFDQIPAEFAHAVAPDIVRLLEKHNCSTAHFMSTSQRTSELARMWGSRELNRIDRYRLYRADANLSMMNQWLDTVPRANPNLRLEFFDSVPDEYLASHTSLFVQFVRDMPTEREQETPFHMDNDEAKRQAEWRRQNNIYLYTYALFDQNGAMVAHTNASINGSDPRDAYQAMTGVERKYRGRGLSKWLKAVLFMKVGEDFPENETMTTDMRAVNEPIQKVNAQMGYVLESQGNEYEIGLKGLRRFLAD